MTIRALSVVGLLLLLSSCVGKKKYNILAASEQSFRTELQKTKRQLADTQADLVRTQDELKALKATTEAELLQKSERLEAREAAIAKLEQDLAQQRKNIEQLNQNKSQLEQNLQAREKRVQELESAIAERDAQAQALRAKIREALKGFSDTDLTVEERDGKVYVSLSQELLFASGSKYVNSKGRQALQQLADVLKKNQEIDITIEGHTDSDGDAKANWLLSTGRANAVLFELIKNEVNPARITAAGRGQYLPVATNDTKEGKALNRRTEIILSPKLEAIFNILNSK